MNTPPVEISTVLGQMKEIATAGYAIGLQITYTTPKFMFQTYSKNWLDFYGEKGLLMMDPTIGWGFENIGTIRWGFLKDNDPAGVLKFAAEHGIRYGITCSQKKSDVDDGVRSVGSFARPDRDFTDEEVEKIGVLFDTLHFATEKQAQLPPETVQQLRTMSIMVTHPGS